MPDELARSPINRRSRTKVIKLRCIFDAWMILLPSHRLLGSYYVVRPKDGPHEANDVSLAEDRDLTH
jgi:hypothetical protein